MKKRLIKNLMLVLTMVVLCFAVGMTASAETWGNFDYNVLDDGTVEIFGYNGSDINIEVPGEIDGKIVTVIGDGAFSNDNSIKSVSIADSVTEIGELAFESSMNLTHIKLPKNLRSIGEHAFVWCFSLNELELSEENEYFSLDEYGVLYNKDQSKLVYYPAAIKRKTYTIPDTVKVIGNAAFYGNATLEEIIIPEGVIEIGDYAFDTSVSLKKIVFPSTIKNIDFFFENPMVGLQSITIPDGVETIDESFIAYTFMLNDIYVESMDVEFIENEEWGMLGVNAPKEAQIKYFEFLNSAFWEQDLNMSHILLDDSLYNQWAEHFVGECINQSTTIHCHPGSTAEEYAINNSHGVKYILTHFYEGEWTYDYDNMIRYRKCIHCDELETEALETTEDGDVDIIAPVDPDADFTVDVMTDYVIIEETLSENISGDFEIVKAFDINLKNKDGVHVQPDGTVKVKLPVDWTKEGVYKVYRVNDDGTLTDMKAYRQGSHMVFDTDHFSVYVIVDESEKVDIPTAPDEPQEETKPTFWEKLVDLIKSFFELIASIFKK
jgi:hypothetical protein